MVDQFGVGRFGKKGGRFSRPPKYLGSGLQQCQMLCECLGLGRIALAQLIDQAFAKAQKLLLQHPCRCVGKVCTEFLLCKHGLVVLPLQSQLHCDHYCHSAGQS